MNKKILVSLAIILFAIFSFTICQATDDVMKNATNEEEIIEYIKKEEQK